MTSEFGFIENLKRYRNFSLIGDDCAILPKDEFTDLLMTADMLVEDVDFKLDWCTAEDIGHKSLAVSLSDIAAMGGAPKWSLVSLAVPNDLWASGFVERFYDGYCRLAEKFGVEVAGGDISRAPDRLVIDSVVGGEVETGTAVKRSGASASDVIWVSGPLGGAGGDLRRLLAGDRDQVSERLLRPLPRVELGQELRAVGVSAMIDLSDGLSGDLKHICEASCVGAEIDAERIPIADGLVESFGDQTALQLALAGGEDFELLVTASPEKNLNEVSDTFRAIGRITSTAALIELIDGPRRRRPMPESWQHFA